MESKEYRLPKEILQQSYSLPKEHAKTHTS